MSAHTARQPHASPQSAGRSPPPSPSTSFPGQRDQRNMPATTDLYKLIDEHLAWQFETSPSSDQHHELIVDWDGVGEVQAHWRPQSSSSRHDSLLSAHTSRVLQDRRWECALRQTQRVRNAKYDRPSRPRTASRRRERERDITATYKRLTHNALRDESSLPSRSTTPVFTGSDAAAHVSLEDTPAEHLRHVRRDAARPEAQDSECFAVGGDTLPLRVRERHACAERALLDGPVRCERVHRGAGARVEKVRRFGREMERRRRRRRVWGFVKRVFGGEGRS